MMNFAAGKMHIQLERSFTGDVNDLDQEFSTPHFLTFLIGPTSCRWCMCLRLSGASIQLT
ncbi:hypothetical protein HRD63_06725 [Lactobacillus delbrueckii subsp. bulgaricus]|uniref:hypothetical protein n=1 Tax=Lactobacillus delbrueckii TaxID=1584 RepID=UPI00155E2AAF|nr:hypothetical protein [Lactobacillus delbrueckii]NRD06900.1 hypothetical protein [Lactobacillus delbrueckii subsp. bulgaricus]